jgi:hypothetical protein
MPIIAWDGQCLAADSQYTMGSLRVTAGDPKLKVLSTELGTIVYAVTGAASFTVLWEKWLVDYYALNTMADSSYPELPLGHNSLHSQLVFWPTWLNSCRVVDNTNIGMELEKTSWTTGYDAAAGKLLLNIGFTAIEVVALLSRHTLYAGGDILWFNRDQQNVQAIGPQAQQQLIQDIEDAIKLSKWRRLVTDVTDSAHSMSRKFIGMVDENI